MPEDEDIANLQLPTTTSAWWMVSRISDSRQSDMWNFDILISDIRISDFKVRCHERRVNLP